MLRFDDQHDDRWKWFEHKGLGIRVELYGPTTDEYSAYVQRYGLGTDHANIPEARVHVAQNWFRGFEGFVKPDGTAHANTPELRALVLNRFPQVWGWIQPLFHDFSAWRAEGNADGGSAS